MFYAPYFNFYSLIDATTPPYRLIVYYSLTGESEHDNHAQFVHLSCFSQECNLTGAFISTQDWNRLRNDWQWGDQRNTVNAGQLWGHLKIVMLFFINSNDSLIS